MLNRVSKKVLGKLVQQGVITEHQAEEAMLVKSKSGTDPGDFLMKRHFLSDKDILAATSDVLDTVPLNLNKIRIAPELLSVIPKRTAISYQILPVARSDKSLVIAMPDPMNIFALDDLKVITKMEITPILANEKDLKFAIKRHYRDSVEKQLDRMIDEVGEGADLVVEDKEDKEKDQTELTPVVMLTKMILQNSVRERASDVVIECMEHTSRVRFRIDGVLHEKFTPPKSFHNEIVSRLKVISELDISENRVPQDGRFSMKVDSRKVDFRVSVVPSSFGPTAVLRVLDKGQAMVDLDSLGFRKKDNSRVKKAIRNPHGMILVCGPTGSGKTTTLYSVLQYIKSPDKNLVTVENPVEYEYKGLNQVSIRAGIGLTFASCLRSILRQDPDVIMVGEIRTYETLDVAVKSALTGHMVLSTLHTNTAADAVTRMINMGLEPFLITSSVELIVAQRLLRRLCISCREAYKPEKKVAEKYNLFDSKGKIQQIFRPAGCEKCIHTGYRGRTAIIETLEISPKIKELILAEAETSEIERLARLEGMSTMRDNGILDVKEGITSLSEVLRMTADNR